MKSCWKYWSDAPSVSLKTGKYKGDTPINQADTRSQRPFFQIFYQPECTIIILLFGMSWLSSPYHDDCCGSAFWKQRPDFYNYCIIISITKNILLKILNQTSLPNLTLDVTEIH